MKNLTLRAWVVKDKAMIQHREVIERAHNQFSDSLGEGNPDVIMMGTGLKSENGIEAFEGDIIYDQDLGVWLLVLWNDKQKRFLLDEYFLGSNGEMHIGVKDFIDISRVQSFVIYGNVHEWNKKIINKK